MRAASAIQTTPRASSAGCGVSISAIYLNPVSQWQGRHAPWPIHDSLVRSVNRKIVTWDDEP